MKTNLLSAALTALCLFASSAMAYDPYLSSNEKDGGGTIYGGVSFGKTKIGNALDAVREDPDGNAYLTSVDCTSGDCDDTNWKAFVGYEITSNLSVEAAYHNLATDTGYGPYKMDITGLSASGIYNVPVGEKLKVFGKVGAMSWELSDSHDYQSYYYDQNNDEYYAYYYDRDGTDILLGTGATYKFNENWGLRGEYEHIGGDLDAGMYSIGAVFSSM